MNLLYWIFNCTRPLSTSAWLESSALAAALCSEVAELVCTTLEICRGKDIASETASSLSKVVEEVRTAASTVDKIADAAEEQAGAVEQVTVGVDQISMPASPARAASTAAFNANILVWKEISSMSSIRKLNRDLSSTMGQINRSADQVASGAGQVSCGAQALAQGATEQADG